MGECEEKPRGPSDEQRFSEDLIGVRQALKELADSLLHVFGKYV
jgi:hypothetical protein